MDFLAGMLVARRSLVSLAFILDQAANHNKIPSFPQELEAKTLLWSVVTPLPCKASSL
jgi:hypothetical protein